MKKSKKKQNIKNGTDKPLIALICVIAVAAVVLLALLIQVATMEPNDTDTSEPSNENIEFVPPEFEANVSVGSPTVPDGMGYLEVYKEGMSFNSFICGEVNIVDGKADVYFTNPEKNTLWMKLRIFDEKGNIIAETGLIKPNEYLKAVTFDTIPKNNSTITMKIMTYEPNTYYSGGAVSLSTVAKVK